MHPNRNVPCLGPFLKANEVTLLGGDAFCRCRVGLRTNCTVPLEISKPKRLYLVSLCHHSSGTHNSGSYSIQESSPLSPDMSFEFLTRLLGLFFDIPFSKWSVTQRTNFTTQLQSGIRYFDMRVAMNRHFCANLSSNSSNDIYSCFFLVHGQYANRVSEELETIKIFLEHHPKEVVIIDFQHFHGLNESLMLVFTDMVREVSLICRQSTLITRCLEKCWNLMELKFLLWLICGHAKSRSSFWAMRRSWTNFKRALPCCGQDLLLDNHGLIQGTLKCCVLSFPRCSS